MRDEFDGLGKLTKNELKKEGEQIEREVLADETLSKIKVDEDLARKIYNRIEAYERERLISQLSEEDRKALLLGREVMEKEQAETAKKIIHKRPRIWKRAIILAAVLVAVLAMGITSVGGPTRVIEIVKQVVGGREVTKINASSEDVKVVETEDEEAAYQQIRDEFGIEPVKIFHKPDGMKFKNLEIVADLRTARLMYSFHEQNISYIINCSYSNDSLGFANEDKLLNSYEYHMQSETAEVKEYELPEGGLKKYIAKFEYSEVYYYLVGTMEKEEFELILDNLFF